MARRRRTQAWPALSKRLVIDKLASGLVPLLLLLLVACRASGASSDRKHHHRHHNHHLGHTARGQHEKHLDNLRPAPRARPELGARSHLMPLEFGYANRSLADEWRSSRARRRRRDQFSGVDRHLASGRGPHFGRDEPLGRPSKRQVVGEVVARLHILESLDEQLRAFAEAAEFAERESARTWLGDERTSSRGHEDEQTAEPPGVRWRDFHCHLRLAAGQNSSSLLTPRGDKRLAAGRRGEEPEGGAGGRPLDEEGGGFCLRNKKLLAQIPPFMLNLYRQLLFELQQTNLSLSETVQQMPYKAQIMRSFRQPKLRLDGPGGSAGVGSTSATSGPTWPADGDRARDKKWPTQENEPPTGARFGPATATRMAIGNVAVKLSVSEGHLGGGKEGHAWEAKEEEEEADGEEEIGPPGRDNNDYERTSPGPPSVACQAKQRLLPAHERDEICFWFKLDEGLAQSIAFDPSAPMVENGRRGPRELLVEAELHVFKLFPQLQAAAVQRDNMRSMGANNIKFAQERRPVHRQAQQPTGQAALARLRQQFQPANRTTTGNLYHLKTNLLEVSLYQILPRKTTIGRDNAQAASRLDDEFPLRLLDIRRIDLNSNGWETFYVKRAVEDWLRDSSLNLGLVIKSKSMFDEPIRVGLIRFADAYDHLDEHHSGQQTGQTQQRRALRDFDLSHQPLLVIYTTTRESS